MYLYNFFHILYIEENKNNLREFEPQNGKKFKKTQAEFKNVVSYKKKKCIPEIENQNKIRSNFISEV